MKMKQREILNHLALDFKRDNQTQEEYLAAKKEQIKRASRDYLLHTGLKGYLLGLSGGVDSFVVAALLADAGVHLHLLMLPNGIQKDIADSQACADVLTRRFDNVVVETVSIENAFAGVQKDIAVSELFDPADRYALGNVQARLRMVEQYALNRGLLVAGTDHATENVTGYFTKYGDGGSDFNPIDGLLKQDIYDIAESYGAPVCVMQKKPSAGLGISANDEEELGMSYAELCAYLRGNLIAKEKMQRIVSLYERGEHKRHLPASPMNGWWLPQPEDATHIVVDMIGAFAEGGAMACRNTEAACAYIVEYINANPLMRVLYARDSHPAEHCSFVPNGGIWPPHAVQGTDECAFLPAFYTEIQKTVNTPLQNYNVFQKGQDPAREEYSAFAAQNEQYGALKFNLTRNVVLSGVATEYCVRSTAQDLLANGFVVSILSQGLAFVDAQGHASALAELAALGAAIL